MDEFLRRLERAAAAGDVEAEKRLLEWQRRLNFPEPIDPKLLVREVELNIDLVIGDNTFEFEDIMTTCYYEIEGQDEPPTYWEPGSRATWIIYHIILSDQDQIDEYNRTALAEGQLPLPSFIRQEYDIYPHLSRRQVERIEQQLEDNDRWNRDHDYDYYD